MIKPTLTGCILLCTSFVFAQLDSNSSIESSRISDQNPVFVHASKTNPSSFGIGQNSIVEGTYSVAIGDGAASTNDNSMVLGGNSEENRVSVGIGTSNPNSLSSLDLGDKDKGLLVNRLSDQQSQSFELALGANDLGMLIYNTSIQKLQTWNGVNWVNVQGESLALENHQLQIHNGTAVDLSSYQQDLTKATLNGKALTIEIENGNDVTVDLSPLFDDFEKRIAALEAKIGQESSTSEFQTSNNTIESNARELEGMKNNPNPFSSSTNVSYDIPEGSTSAYLLCLNKAGQIVSNKELIAKTGKGEANISGDGLTPGIYYLSLYIDRVKTETITMVVR